VRVNVNVHTFGRQENPALVLLHGIGIGHRLWMRQIEAFQQSHFVIAPDIDGLAGRAVPDRTDIGDIARILEDEIMSRSPNAVAVCGISAGASVALALAARMGSRISRLVLSAPHARAPRLPFGLQIAICNVLPERALVAISKKSVGNDPEIAAFAAEDCKALGKRGLLAAMNVLWKLDLRNELRSVVARTTVLCGEKDPVNVPAARAIARSLPDARLWIEPQAGHLWNVQTPQRFNEVLRQVLNTSIGERLSG
jgi:pimeloyl-ACP methyl ester carboxylesterase